MSTQAIETNKALSESEHASLFMVRATERGTPTYLQGLCMLLGRMALHQCQGLKVPARTVELDTDPQARDVSKTVRGRAFLSECCAGCF